MHEEETMTLKKKKTFRKLFNRQKQHRQNSWILSDYKWTQTPKNKEVQKKNKKRCVRIWK